MKVWRKQAILFGDRQAIATLRGVTMAVSR
jgi:hypothetical protein